MSLASERRHRLEREIHRLEDNITEVKRLHQPGMIYLDRNGEEVVDDDFCAECQRVWPCRTNQLLKTRLP